MEWIFKYYSKEGDVVLDPTMGSGSTGVACKNMNRNFIGIEMDDEIFEVMRTDRILIKHTCIRVISLPNNLLEITEDTSRVIL